MKSVDFLMNSLHLKTVKCSSHDGEGKTNSGNRQSHCDFSTGGPQKSAQIFLTIYSTIA